MVRREINFPKFFFDFLVQNDSIRKKKQTFFLKILIFFLSLRNVEGQKGEFFCQNFFFDFLVQNDSIRKKKQNFFLKILIFFSKSKECGGF